MVELGELALVHVVPATHHGKLECGILVGLALLLLLGGCGKKTADSARLSDELRRLRSEVAAHLADHRKAERRLRLRVARLEAELATLKRRPPPGVGAGGPIPGEDVPPRRDPDGVGDRPAPRVSCPAALPDAARKVRRRMRLANVRKLLVGVKLHKSKALTLSGSGSRTRRVWSGPCFRITIEAGRVATVEFDGVKDKKRRRRRRR